VALYVYHNLFNTHHVLCIIHTKRIDLYLPVGSLRGSLTGMASALHSPQTPKNPSCTATVTLICLLTRTHKDPPPPHTHTRRPTPTHTHTTRPTHTHTPMYTHIHMYICIYIRDFPLFLEDVVRRFKRSNRVGHATSSRSGRRGRLLGQGSVLGGGLPHIIGKGKGAASTPQRDFGAGTHGRGEITGQSRARGPRRRHSVLVRENSAKLSIAGKSSRTQPFHEFSSHKNLLHQ